jgi:DMSO/TMAO reductase YedYZ molybdopterin-dependent catalytic subunit
MIIKGPKGVFHMTPKNKQFYFYLAIPVVLILLIGTPYLIMYIMKGDPDTTVRDLEEGPEMLGDVAISQYNGTKLGSAEDFRENSINGPQYVDIDTYKLRITGLVDQEVEYSYDDLLSNSTRYRKIVTLNCVEGWNVKILWDGLLVRDVIAEAGPRDTAKVLIFKAVDGYTTSLPIEFFYDNDILIAFGMNNITLEPERGFPFQLVAEMKWGYKWIKWIDEIEISDDINYKGYWEERGYSNDADLDEPSWEG